MMNLFSDLINLNKKTGTKEAINFDLFAH